MVTGGYQKYQQNSVMTASPKELILLLYNGAIKFCNLALEAFEQKDIVKQHQYIVRVQDIIVELQISLDNKIEISREINELYEYIKRLLVEANINKNASKVQEVKDLIVEFRNMWQELMKIA